jgi:ubiquitin-like modifier-activating enzyme ATG7
MHSGDVVRDPSLLNRFGIISFADLKKFKFFYWFAFPSITSRWTIKQQTPLDEIPDSVVQWVNNADVKQRGHFILDNGIAKPLEQLPADATEIHVGFMDSCLIPNRPSKLLQNFLTLLSLKGFNNVKVDIYRVTGDSFALELENIDTDTSKVSGWERTSQGKLGPKLADLGALIDPVKLSEQSVDLNLKLMKWRVAPDIDLDVVKNLKVLLLGSGTLGSYVARTLLGWGVRTITMVDNGTVSFSNPVRQPLFNFEDVGKPKAQTAADALKRIFPLVEANGYDLEIPMAGHPVTNDETQKKDLDRLDKLIQEHDALFLLTDSRETRWLPTVIGNVKNKIVINCALGFDSYLVMRHGVERNLGCYFCNDVVAPTDSLTDRTLDQMCTVTRPGVALMASSLGVELLVSLLQHPKKHYADANESTILGNLPHQLRGFLSNHETMKLQAPAYDYCSACSEPVLDAYRQEGWTFVSKALNNPLYIEELSGLAEVHRQAEKAVADLEEDFSDDEWNI